MRVVVSVIETYGRRYELVSGIGTADDEAADEAADDEAADEAADDEEADAGDTAVTPPDGGTAPEAGSQDSAGQTECAPPTGAKPNAG